VRQQNGQRAGFDLYQAEALRWRNLNAVELATGDELFAVLVKLKAAVGAGELDAQIETASGALRAGFGK